MTNNLPRHMHCFICGIAVPHDDAVERGVNAPVFAPQGKDADGKVVMVQVAQVQLPAHLCPDHAAELDAAAEKAAEEAKKAETVSRLTVVRSHGAVH
jgi:hypothetical protein